MTVPVDADRNEKEAASAPPPSAIGTAPDGVAAAPAAEAILSVNNIEVVYDHVILVLKGVSLEVPKGEIVALLGANGAGTSTTLKAISNLLAAERGAVTKGSIVFGGGEVHALTPSELVRRGCIQVMEGRHCFAHLSVEENLLTGAVLRQFRVRQAGTPMVDAVIRLVQQREVDELCDPALRHDAARRAVHR